MTLFALAFMLFAAGLLVAWLPARRLGAYGAWMLLTAGCALIAWIAVGTLTGGVRYALVNLALPVIGAFGFELTPLAALFLLITVAVFAAELPFALRDSLVWAAAHWVRRPRSVVRRAPWDAGLPRLRPEMAYTATAFAAPVRVLFHAVFSPEVARQEEHQGAFLTARRHQELRVHVVERVFIRPLTQNARRLAAQLAELHHGKVTVYAGYVLAALIAVLLIVRVSYRP